MTLKLKIAILIGIPVLSLVVLVGFGSLTIKGLSGGLNSIVNDQFLVLVDEQIIPLVTDDMLPLINEDVTRIQNLQTSIQLMLEADRDVHQTVIAEKMMLVASEPSEISAADKANSENIEQARSRMAQAAVYFDSDEARIKYDEFLSAFNSWTEKTRNVISLANTPGKLTFARKASDGGSASRTFNEMRSKIDELQAIMQREVEGELAQIAVKKDRINERHEVVVRSRDYAVAAAGREEEQASASVPIFFAIGIAVAVLVMFVGYLVARSISRPISKLATVAQNVALGDVDQTVEVRGSDEIGILAKSFADLVEYLRGMAAAAESISRKDLTTSVTPKGEHDVLGNAFRKMLAILSGMIHQLNDNASQLVSAANQIASSSEQMSRGAGEQAQQIAQVSAAIEQMSAASNDSAKNSGAATDTSRNASEVAVEGGRIVNDATEGMRKIADVVKQTSGSIGRLADSATQIGEIISVIDDIADQTNLLALNAAIEAARAGEQGRGFAVVADEVRKLAERTGQATGEITAMIKGVQESTREAVGSMEAGIKEVEVGQNLTDKAGASLTEIVNMSQRVMDMIRQVSVASEEQSKSAEEISRNVDNVLAVTRETAQGAEQSAAAAEELSRQAESLKEMVLQFKVD